MQNETKDVSNVSSGPVALSGNCRAAYTMAVDPFSESGSRILFYFPIIHNQEDMGSLGDAVRKASLKKLGRAGWRQQLAQVDKLWTAIEDFLNALDLPFERVRVYQDGLPLCGQETRIVETLADKGNRNYTLVRSLIRRGARLMGTESVSLLLEELALQKKCLGSAGFKDTGEAVSDSATLLQRRDAFIARQINETLKPGEVGIIFLGMLHNLAELAEDIRVVYPTRRH